MCLLLGLALVLFVFIRLSSAGRYQRPSTLTDGKLNLAKFHRPGLSGSYRPYTISIVADYLLSSPVEFPLEFLLMNSYLPRAKFQTVRCYRPYLDLTNLAVSQFLINLFNPFN